MSILGIIAKKKGGAEVIITNPYLDTITLQKSVVWTVPAGVQQIVIECIGAGGGSATSYGGGGGAYSRANLNVTVGQTFSIQVGKGQVRSEIKTSTGDTTFETLVKAEGASESTEGLAANSAGSIKFNGTGGIIGGSNDDSTRGYTILGGSFARINISTQGLSTRPGLGGQRSTGSYPENYGNDGAVYITLYGNSGTYTKENKWIVDFRSAYRYRTTQLPVTFNFVNPVNLKFEWLDGTSDTFNSGTTVSHTIALDTIGKVKITGACDKISMTNSYSMKYTAISALNGIAITSANGMFLNQWDLKSIPPNLFESQLITDFTNCFSGCTSLLYALPLWDSFPGAIGTGCYAGCLNASNYADIPAGWK